MLKHGKANARHSCNANGPTWTFEHDGIMVITGGDMKTVITVIDLTDRPQLPQFRRSAEHASSVPRNKIVRAPATATKPARPKSVPEEASSHMLTVPEANAKSCVETVLSSATPFQLCSVSEGSREVFPSLWSHDFLMELAALPQQIRDPIVALIESMIYGLFSFAIDTCAKTIQDVDACALLAVEELACSAAAGYAIVFCLLPHQEQQMLCLWSIVKSSKDHEKKTALQHALSGSLSRQEILEHSIHRFISTTSSLNPLLRPLPCYSEIEECAFVPVELVPDEMPDKIADYTPSLEQKKYIAHNDGTPLMVQGRGGTGKTFVLMYRMLLLAQMGDQKPLCLWVTKNSKLIQDVQRKWSVFFQNKPDASADIIRSLPDNNLATIEPGSCVITSTTHDLFSLLDRSIGSHISVYCLFTACHFYILPVQFYPSD